VIQNGDGTFGLGAVLELHRRTGLRVVWDILHHHCHDADGIDDLAAPEAAPATWPAEVVPKVVMLEAKGKDLALLQLRAPLERETAIGRRS